MPDQGPEMGISVIAIENRREYPWYACNPGRSRTAVDEKAREGFINVCDSAHDCDQLSRKTHRAGDSGGVLVRSLSLAHELLSRQAN